MKSIVILTCLYDDWQSAADLFAKLGGQLAQRSWTVELLIANDGSLEPPPNDFLKIASGFSQIGILNLNRNIGSQRAIAVGLSHTFETSSADAVIVMDSDGEDKPEDVIRLIEALESQTAPKIIFAERIKRSESAFFRIGYQFYRALHYLLTGYGIRFGNFSIIPKSLLGRLVIDPNLWLHYAATVVSSKTPYATIPTNRAKRLHGESKVNLANLVIHGLAAISCYNELVGVRLIFLAMGLSALLSALIIVVIFIKFATDLAIQGWATVTVGVLLVLLVQISLMVIAFAAIAISSRKTHFFFPIQQYKFLIRDVESIR